jgi:hypothetical protein
VESPVLCAACGAEVRGQTEGPCPSCAESILLRDRYRLEAVVGQGAAGTTYRAVDGQTGDLVAVKEMPLRHTERGLAAGMEREARVLAELHHDRIPSYVEHFLAGSGKQLIFYLVQQFVEGPTLAAEMKSRRYTEDEVLDVVDELLGILAYLQALRPPVLHRDLKPGNVVRRRHDRALVLIDFGSVRDVITDPRAGGSTVAGTYGFMAPEQFRGDAGPQTDLYALGVTAIVMLSRRDPIDLVQPDHSLAWEAAVMAEPEVKAFLRRLLSADPAERPESALAAREALARARAGAPVPESPPSRPVPAPAPQRALAPAGQTSMRKRVGARSKGLAMLLCLGAVVGAQNWYLGRWFRAILGFVPVVGIAIGIWDFIGLVNMDHEDFDQRYNPQLVELEQGQLRIASEEIGRLHALLQQGALTDDEYQRQKSRILGDRTPQLHRLFDMSGLDGLFGQLGQLKALPEQILDEVFGPLDDPSARKNKRRRRR